MSDTVTSPAEIPGGAVRIGNEAPEEQTRVVLFYLGEKAYTIPKTLSGAALLTMLEVSITGGGQAAILYALQEGLGREGYADLRNAEGMGEEQLSDLLRRVEGLYLPQAERLGKASTAG